MSPAESIKLWYHKESLGRVAGVVFALFILLSHPLLTGFFEGLLEIVLPVVWPEGATGRHLLFGQKTYGLTRIVAALFLGYTFRKQIWGYLSGLYSQKWDKIKLLSWIWLTLPGIAFYIIGAQTLLVSKFVLFCVGLITMAIVEIAILNFVFQITYYFGRAGKGVAIFVIEIYAILVVILTMLVRVVGEFDFLKYATMIPGADYTYLFRLPVLLSGLIFIVITGIAITNITNSSRQERKKKTWTPVLIGLFVLIINPVILFGELIALPLTNILSHSLLVEVYNIDGIIAGHLPNLFPDFFEAEAYTVYPVVPEVFRETSEVFGLFDSRPFDESTVDSLNFQPYERIIFLTIESFSLEFTGYREAPCTQSITPFLDSLMAVYPSAGLWTSASPTLYGLSAMMSSHPNAKMVFESGFPNSFVKLLSQNGYRTPFVRSAPERYLNEHVLFKQAGFSEVYGREYFYNLPNYQPHISGWGLEDAYVYKFAVDYLTKHRSEKVFMHILPADTHSPLGRDHYSDSYPDWPADLSCRIDNETYLKSIYRQDYDIRRLYNQIEDAGLFDDNTLLIITADHSAPRGYNPAPEILSQIPVIFISKNKISQLTLNQKNISQVDLAPTILDLAGLAPPAGYWGKTLFDNQNRSYLGYHGGFITVREEDQVRNISIKHPAGKNDETLVKILNSIILQE